MLIYSLIAIQVKLVGTLKMPDNCISEIIQAPHSIYSSTNVEGS
jgi:hypothetical protein